MATSGDGSRQAQAPAGSNSAALNAAEWAEEYYRDRHLPAMSEKKWRAVLDAAAGRAAKSKVGLPKARRPMDAGDGAPSFADFMEDCQAAAEEGYGMATLVALKWHLYLRPDEPVPEWIRARVAEGVAQWEQREFETLDEALQAKRPRGTRPTGPRRMAGMMWQDAEAAAKAGVGRTRALYAEIAERYNTSAPTVERLVTRFRRPSSNSKRY